MTFEDFEKATPEKLREEAKSCFDKAEENPSWGGAPTLLLQAQFYMMERDRREAGRVAERDFSLERIVIGLISLELIAAAIGIWLTTGKATHRRRRFRVSTLT
jgi:hypothetical protein